MALQAEVLEAAKRPEDNIGHEDDESEEYAGGDGSCGNCEDD